VIANHCPEADVSQPDETIDFEKSLNQLESLVESMEDGEMSLEESLKAFEDGIRLTRQCQQALSAAEQRVQILLEKDGALKTEPFEGADELAVDSDDE